MSKFDELFAEFDEAADRAAQYGTMAHTFYAQGRWEKILEYVHALEAEIVELKGRIENNDK